MLLWTGQGKAWIAYGFQSGMSRFSVTRLLSDNASWVITDGERQTQAGPSENRAQYSLVYCSTPQKLYLMRFRLDDSLQAFVETRQKFERRYGEPTALQPQADFYDAAAWADAEVSFLWDVNESETVLLMHSGSGTSAEFQDLSVCR